MIVMVDMVVFRRLLSFLVLILAVSSAQAFADDDPYMRLTRISYLDGNVSYQSISDTDWATAGINMPLEPGDRIYTGPGGKMEIEFDDGSVIRLAENTDMEVMALRTDLIQMRILLGFVYLNSTRGDADFEINTPAAAFNISREGLYRLHVKDNGDVDVIVRKGSLEAANNFFVQRIGSGERLYVHYADSGRPLISRYTGRDAWDEWNDRRDADRVALISSRRHVPDNVRMGVAELDRHGRWVNVSSYGWAWVPYAAGTSWSPYSTGRWLYRPFFGWTWVSYEPWGWLPYHYGRWYMSASHGWCWIPGPAFSFNFWSPGLVAFYSGPGWVSWAPLGPGDFYSINRYHFNRVVFSHQLIHLRALHTRPPERPYNKNVRGAFRTVQLEHFRSGSYSDRSVNTRWGTIDKPWEKGSLERDRISIRPTSASFRATSDRPSVRPPGTTVRNSIIRTDPGTSARNREQLTRITNPSIPPVSSSRFSRNGDEHTTIRENTERVTERDNPGIRRERSVPGTSDITGRWNASSANGGTGGSGRTGVSAETSAGTSVINQSRWSNRSESAGTGIRSDAVSTSPARSERNTTGTIRPSPQSPRQNDARSSPATPTGSVSIPVVNERSVTTRGPESTPPAATTTRTRTTVAQPSTSAPGTTVTAPPSSERTGTVRTITSRSSEPGPAAERQNRGVPARTTGVTPSNRSNESNRAVGSNPAGTSSGSSLGRWGNNSGANASEGNSERRR
jgi:hypothetical protein